MKFVKNSFSVLLISTLVMVSCTTSDTSTTEDDETVSGQVETTLDVVSDAMDGINDTGQSNLSYLRIRDHMKSRPLLYRATEMISDMLLGEPLHAAISCTSGAISKSPESPSWGSSSTLDITRTFSSCATARFSIAGTTDFRWSNLATTGGAPYLQVGSKLLRAPGLTITRTATGGTVTIAGNGSLLTTNKVSHTLEWSSVDTAANTRAFTVNIDVTRTGKSASGVELFTHTAKTTEALVVSADLNAQTRTITSGTIEVTGKLGLTTATTKYSSVVWDSATCQPKSGTITTSLSGLRTGSATVTFNNDGTADYNFTGNKRNAKGKITLKGC